MRTSNSIFTLFLATAALGGAASGCARNRAAAEVSPNAVTSVEVVNHNFSDMDIFATRPGANRIRLGMVTGESAATFKLPPGYAAWGTVNIIGVPIGGFGVARSGNLSINPGETIVFTVEQHLAASMATVEQP